MPETPNSSPRHPALVATISRASAALVKAALQLVEACHVARNKGKATGECNSLASADPKGTFAARRAKATAKIDKRCATAELVCVNYPDGLVVPGIVPALESGVEASAVALQGAPALAGDKAAGKCHAAIAKARTAIVLEILKRSIRCQQALDKTAASFGILAGACMLDATKVAQATGSYLTPKEYRAQLAA